MGRLLGVVLAVLFAGACGGGDECGNGQREGDEQCDRGPLNGQANSGCSLQCRVVGQAPSGPTTSGRCTVNGVVDPGEQCDPILEPQTCNPQTCTRTGTSTGTCVADGVVGPGEQCDPRLEPQTCDPRTCTRTGTGGGTTTPAAQFIQIRCGQTLHGDTRAPMPFVTQFSQYNCVNRAQRGPEHIYFFLASRNDNALLDVDDDGDVRVNWLVLADTPEPNRCIEFDENVGRVQVQAGRGYYVTLDSERQDQAGRYSIRLDCN